MQTHLIKIGNSKGVRLPKAVLDQAGLEGPVTLTVTDQGLLLAPSKAVRAGWAEAAQALAAESHAAENAEDRGWREMNASDDRDWTW